MKKSYKNNNLKISATTRKFELPDTPYSILYIQNYFEYILKKHREKTVNPSIRIYINKIENITTIKIKTGYYLELLTPETIKLLRSTTSETTKDENGENVPNLEITKVVLVYCNIVNNNYQQKSKVLYTFVLNKLFGQLLDISQKKIIFLKTFHSEF